MSTYRCPCGRLFNDANGKAEIEESCPQCWRPRRFFEKVEEDLEAKIKSDKE